MEISSCNFFITLSRGTPHKTPPLDSNGFPIYESVVSANYLREREINPSSILTEVISDDTIGNAYFSRVIHTDVRNLKKLLIITSKFHMPRTKEIFNFVYGLGNNNYDLEFEAVPNVGIDDETLIARIEKEQRALEAFKETEKRIRNLAEFHKWLYTKHGCYAIGKAVKRIENKAKGSY